MKKSFVGANRERDNHNWRKNRGGSSDADGEGDDEVGHVSVRSSGSSIGGAGAAEMSQ